MSTDRGILWAQFHSTMFLIEVAHDWERLARDESLEDELRVKAALRARAIREELRPA